MDSISRNATYAIASQVATSAFTAATTIYLVRALGPEQYGVLALALSVGTLMALPSDFGISSSAARFIAERRGDKPAAAAIYADAFRLRLIASTIVSATLIATSGAIADAYDQPNLAWALRGVAIAVFGQTLFMLNRSVLTALGRLAVFFRIVVSESVIEAASTVALVLLGGGAAGAAFGRAAGYLVGGWIAVLAVLRLLGARGRPRGFRMRSGHVRQLATYAGALFLIDGAFTLFEQIDVLLIGAYLDVTAVGLFEAPLKITSFLHYPGLAIAFAVAPRLARGVEGPNVTAFETALRLVLIIQLGLAAVTLVWARPIVDLALGSDYEGSVDTMRALAPYVLLSGVAPLVSLAVNYLGEARRRIPIAVGAVLINTAIDVILIPRIGIVAGAIGTTVAFALYVPAHLWICKRTLNIDLGSLGRTALRGTFAAAVLAGVLALVGTAALSALEWVGGALLGALAFASALVITGEVSRAELRAARLRMAQIAGSGR